MCLRDSKKGGRAAMEWASSNRERGKVIRGLYRVLKARVRCLDFSSDMMGSLLEGFKQAKDTI